MFQVRPGVESDLPDALRLIVELAVFEKEPDAVVTTVETMKEDAFGENPIFGFLVAESDGCILGISVYYFRYSTWKGKRMYLEDLVVTEDSRGQGIGAALFESTMQLAVSENCRGMTWQVLDWNTPAIDFYKKYGADIQTGWLNCNFGEDELRALVNG